ncbi:MAG: N4-gp56 family major capsid protein [Methylophilaceae bacterium]|nr:MAG: N4-gp56 family major capsid protein [Methylophilaceae bacterium]
MALTQVSSLDISKAAYEQLAYYALRPELYYDSLVEIQATNATSRGTSVTFTIASDLAEASTALTETSDVTPVAMSDSYVTVTPSEYGNAVQLTSKLGATAFLEVNPVAANVVGWNAGISTDAIARTAAGAGTNVAYTSGTTRAGLAKTNTLAGNDVRKAVANLRKNNVATFNGMYKGLIHPDVSYDFRGATGGTNWSDPHVYSDPSGIYNGVIGNFQGVQFMETPRAPFFADGGLNSFTISTIAVASSVATITTSAAHGLAVGDTLTISGATATSGTASASQLGFNAQFTVATVPTTTTLTVSVAGLSAVAAGTSLALVVDSVDVYGTLVMGRQALAKAFSTGGGYGEQAQIVDVPVIDTLRRFTGVGWKHFVGYGVLRQASLYRIESGSSIAQ